MPFILVCVGLELYLTFSESTFYNKASYLKTHLDTAEILILGSSHNQNAINPDYLDHSSINLAYGGQDISIDSALFFNYAPKMDHLKAVVLELGYTTINDKREKDYFRLPWYYKYYKVELFPLPLLKKWSIYASSPTYFNRLLKDKLNPNRYVYKINRNGFIENDFPGILDSLHYSIEALQPYYTKAIQTYKQNDATNNMAQNFNTIKHIIAYCNDRHIKVFVTSPPIYLNRSDFENEEKAQMLNQFITDLTQDASPYYLNFENNEAFTVKDFKDFTHLNSDGAKKYSLLLSHEISSILDNH